MITLILDWIWRCQSSLQLTFLLCDSKAYCKITLKAVSFIGLGCRLKYVKEMHISKKTNSLITLQVQNVEEDPLGDPLSLVPDPSSANGEKHSYSNHLLLFYTEKTYGTD